MIRIIKANEPKELSIYRSKHPTHRYSDLDRNDEGRNVRQIIRKSLVNEQFGLCAYCCCMITDDGSSSLNEHIRPQDLFPNDTLDYNNLIASCKNSDTCGNKKDNDYYAEFVSPLNENCEEYFIYHPDGEISGTDPDNHGNRTIATLNLNSYKLKKSRRAMLKNAQLMQDDIQIKEYILTPDSGKYNFGFIDIVKYYIGHKEMFDSI